MSETAGKMSIGYCPRITPWVKVSCKTANRMYANAVGKIPRERVSRG
jgi:hypothetical protein